MSTPKTKKPTKFKAESKRLLDLMINSIYTNNEIFLRELISNASDALDKRYYSALDGGETIDRDSLKIEIALDGQARTLTISDNGCGMTKANLEKYLGTIAHSGTLEFKNTNQQAADIIGQFGVGFYSAFMVASRIEVCSRADGEDVAHLWSSDGAEGFVIEESSRDQCGTTIKLFLKADTEDNRYSDFADAEVVRFVIKKYSDYIRYPIVVGGETANSMTPLWKKSKAQATQEEYESFYKEKFFDHMPPLKVISYRVEGALTFDALLFVPSVVPYNYMSKDFAKGLQLYSNGVLIMDKCGDLLPDHFGFVRGVVDSSDLSLNISREMLQQDRQVRALANSISKKINTELTKMLKDEREKYEKFFESFGISIKFGVYDSFGAHAAELKDLLIFASSQGGMTTLAEYVGRIKEGQTSIYYATGDSVDHVARLPACEAVLDKGYEILFLTHNVDEFVLKVLGEYEGRQFCSVSSADLGLDKEQTDEDKDKHQPLLSRMEGVLKGKVSAVRLSQRLKSSAVCLSSDGEISIEMEKTMSAIPQGGGIKAKKVLEINPAHPIFDRLSSLFEADSQDFDQLTSVLYGSACLIEGLPLEDAVDFVDKLTKLSS